jgi:hypothetical protein
MAKRSTKGADFLARERGLSGPAFVSSCANLFSKRGDEWLTPREKDKEYPLRRSVMADEPNSPEQLRVSDIRRKMKKDAHQAKMIKKGEAIAAAVQAGYNELAVLLIEEFVHLRETQGDATKDGKAPQLRVHVDPDMDMFTKASRREEKKEYVDVQGKAIESCPQRKAAAALISMRRGMQASGAVELKRQTKAGRKVKGSFYRFEDVSEQVQDTERHAPRPFLGITPVKEEKRRKKK